MDFVPLTNEQRQSFDDDGFLVVRDVLDKPTVEQLIEAGDRRARAFLNKPELLEKEEYNHLDLRPALLKEKPFFSLLTHSPTVPLVVQLLSPNIQLHSLTMIYKRPVNPQGTPFRSGWDRDIRIPKDLGHRDLPRVGIKICYCLTDFHKPNSGMTLFARRTHLRPEALKIRKGEIDPEGVEVCDLTLNAGDAVLFENRVFHTAAPNRSDRTSKVLIYGYAYRWMKPEVYLETLDQHYLEKVSPIGRQLLG